jgi:hypothetical protein
MVRAGDNFLRESGGVAMHNNAAHVMTRRSLLPIDHSISPVYCALDRSHAKASYLLKT